MILKRAIALLLFIISVALFNVTVFAKDEYRNEPIEVFYPLQQGFSEMGENGNFTGYTYDFLMKIAQLSGYKYEFKPIETTNASLLDGLNRVKSGEIDLTGAMVKTPELEEEYAYCSRTYGATNYTLVAQEDNEAVNSRTLKELYDFKISVMSKAENQQTMIDDYCRKNSINYTFVFANTDAQCREMVRNGTADATISKDAANNIGFKTIAKLSSQPFYFAASKSNAPLIKELDELIATLNLTHPGFQDELHKKYFTRPSDYMPELTKKEKDFIDNSAPINMIIPTNRAPLYSFDSATGNFNGIIIDIIDLISQKSGLKFNFITAQDRAEVKKLLNADKADMIAGISYDFTSLSEFYKSNLLMTSPVFSSPIVRIANVNGTGRRPETLVATSIKFFDGAENITSLDDIARIFMLVNSGEYKEAYVNGYMAQHYIEENYTKNVSLTPTPYSNYDMSLGVVRGRDWRLMSILEQSIAAITPQELEDIVYKNTNHARKTGLMAVIKRNPIEFIIPITALLAVIIALLVVLVIKTRRINKIISQEKNKYQEISQRDLLTNTFNNDTFKRLAKEYLSGKDEVPSGALIICDVDGFKYINDTYGHLCGDEALSRIGAILSATYRGEDIVGRIGGDEFAVLVKGFNSPDMLSQRCEQLLKKGSIKIDELKITLSIGAVVFSGKAEFEELFKRADTVLYEVKAEGKNSYKIYNYNNADINSRV